MKDNNITVKDLNTVIGFFSEDSKGKISDGYHTFDELYDYRMIYNAALFNEWAHTLSPMNGYGNSLFRFTKFNIHKSTRHSDGGLCFGGGWFIVMAELPTGQISNHYPMKYWDLFKIPIVERANVWDGHTPQQAFERLTEFVRSMHDIND